MDRLIRWCEKTAEIAGDADKKQYFRDAVLQLALSKCIEMVGESAGDIQTVFPEFARNNPHLSLAKAYGMRNRLVHIYEDADLDIVWDTVVLFVPQLKKDAEVLRKAM
jgi:uncharacterized protein with HEPN domain